MWNRDASMRRCAKCGLSAAFCFLDSARFDLCHPTCVKKCVCEHRDASIAACTIIEHGNIVAWCVFCIGVIGPCDIGNASRLTQCAPPMLYYRDDFAVRAVCVDIAPGHLHIRGLRHEPIRGRIKLHAPFIDARLLRCTRNKSTLKCFGSGHVHQMHLMRPRI